jgi:hypothetical protein
MSVLSDCLARNLAQLQLERIQNPGIDQSEWLREVTELAAIVHLEERELNVIEKVH